MNYNGILNTDSYKLSMHKQYPPGTTTVYSYIEARGGIYDKLVFFGLQAFLKEYMTKPITQNQIDRAEKIVLAHGEPFNREGWEYILKEHNGYLPIEIRSVDEGTIIPVKNALVVLWNTDPKCFWLTTHVETSLLRGVWYPTTVATNSYASKQVILKYLEETGDPSILLFRLHDFGSRGVSSYESSLLGGMAHLVNFLGTDTTACLEAIMEWYNTDQVVGFSLPAMEHSTVTSWGREHEVDAYRNMLKQYAKKGTLLAAVSDSYDIYEACKLWGTVLKQEVIDSGAVVIIRPDGGEPSHVVLECVRILDKYFGSTTNSKGYKVLNYVRVIQGDGITTSTINGILFCLQMAGYSADNVAFGQGGALLQQVNRDTSAFALKCSAVEVNYVWRDVYKDPITDSGKRSKCGRFSLVQRNGEFQTILESERHVSELDWLIVRYRDGQLYNETTFEEVRARANEK